MSDDTLDFLQQMEDGRSDCRKSGEPACRCLTFGQCPNPVAYKLRIVDISKGDALGSGETFYVCQRCVTEYRKANHVIGYEWKYVIKPCKLIP